MGCLRRAFVLTFNLCHNVYVRASTSNVSLIALLVFLTNNIFDSTSLSRSAKCKRFAAIAAPPVSNVFKWRIFTYLIPLVS